MTHSFTNTNIEAVGHQPSTWRRLLNPINLVKILVLICLLTWFGAQLAEKIDLTTADLGRHITNGRILVQGSTEEKLAVLHTNFYSYTLPNETFVNHHWLSGVVFYAVNQLWGFGGLSVVYILLGVLTLALFFFAAARAGNFWLAVFFSVLLLPLVASRAEVRPEMFTYFFSGVFYVILSQWRTGRLKHKWLIPLPFLMLLWVNLHIGFVFGFLLLGAFGLEQLFRMLLGKANGFMPLLVFGLLCALLALVNPFGYKALLYPLDIFKNYGYLIVENQSIRFLENLGFGSGRHFVLFKSAAAACAGAFVLWLAVFWRRVNWPDVILVAASGTMAYLGIRHFPSFAFFALPFLAASAAQLLVWTRKHVAYRIMAAAMGLLASAALLLPQWQALAERGNKFGIGLEPGASASAEFFLKNQIKGPVFNDYDIGGYLIYYLYPDEKVFVDNRPEAYTEDFFKNIYEAAQQDPGVWEKLDSQYHFNAIFFSHRDYTPWAQQFLISRIQDENWVPVFADAYNIIFIRKSKENVQLIQKYYISPENFKIIQQ